MGYAEYFIPGISNGYSILWDTFALDCWCVNIDLKNINQERTKFGKSILY